LSWVLLCCRLYVLQQQPQHGTDPCRQSNNLRFTIPPLPRSGLVHVGVAANGRVVWLVRVGMGADGCGNLDGGGSADKADFVRLCCGALYDFKSRPNSDVTTGICPDFLRTVNAPVRIWLRDC